MRRWGSEGGATSPAANSPEERDRNLGDYLWPGTHWGTCEQNKTSEGKLCNDPAVLIWTLAYIGMFAVLAWWLNRKKIFVKI